MFMAPRAHTSCIVLLSSLLSGLSPPGPSLPIVAPARRQRTQETQKDVRAKLRKYFYVRSARQLDASKAYAIHVEQDWEQEERGQAARRAENTRDSKGCKGKVQGQATRRAENSRDPKGCKGKARGPPARGPPTSSRSRIQWLLAAGCRLLAGWLGWLAGWLGWRCWLAGWWPDGARPPEINFKLIFY